MESQYALTKVIKQQQQQQNETSTMEVSLNLNNTGLPIYYMPHHMEN